MVRRLAVLFAVFFSLAPISAFAFPDPTASPTTNATVPHELIVRFRSDASDWQREALRQRMNGRVKWQFRRPDVQLIELETGSVDDVILELAADPLIEYIEPNYRVQVLTTPNDSRFSELWGMHNTGQTGGTPGADIRALAAWDVFTGDPDMRVGVIDTGVDYNHPDLVDNIWTNPGEIPANGVDDDGNGYVDDIHGYDFVNFDGDPMDDYGHGTHVSGTIAGVGNNGIGVAGVNWHAKIVGIKFLDAGGFGTTAGAIAAVEYSIAIGLKITNNSWGGGGYSDALLDAINDAGTAGQIFVAAAGNGYGNNNDLNPQYPASYPSSNIISVAATDHNDLLADFSNIGATTVDLAAPGASVLSTIPGGSYTTASGTSMATPHVSGVLALLWARRPSLTLAQVKARLFAGVDARPALAGKMVTGGRLNALLAVGDPDSIPPAPISTLTVLGTTSNTVLLTWIATGDDGSTGKASSYDVRYSTAPINAGNIDSAARFSGPDPRPAGAPDSVEVTGLPFSTTHYFAVRALDEFSNPGPISNVVSTTTLGAPDVALSPISISATLSGTSTTRTLTIANVGAGTLDFNIPSPVTALAPMIPNPNLVVAKGVMDPRPGFPVVADQGGPDSYGYRWVDSDDPGGPVFDWVDLTTSGTLTSLTGDEDVTESLPLGFTFPFYGNNFDSVKVAANGWLSFTDARIPSYNIQPLPSSGPQAPANLVAPFWSDLHLGGARKVYVQSDGDRFIVSWVGVGHYFLPGTFTFQAVLYRSGEVRFQYHTLTGPVNYASIGIQNAARTVGLNIGFLTEYARPGLAVRILPPASWLTANPQSGRVFAGSSQIVTLTLDATSLIGGTYRSDLHVTSNDPDESDSIVPVQLVSVGVPEIDLSATAIDFGSVFTGGTVPETLIVRNPGTDSLRVTSVTASHPAFAAAVSSLVVPPLSLRRLIVRFTPLANGPSSGTLTLVSNDADEGVRTVALSGIGLPPPDIAVAPESLWVGVDVGGTASRTLRVSNVGESDLDVIVSTQEFFPGSGSIPTGPIRLPIDPPATAPRPELIGPLANTASHPQPPAPLAGLYSGTQLSFGVTDYGEIMPFQFPVGSEHLATGAWISGYTVGFKSGPDSILTVYTAANEYRYGFVPESYQELEVNDARVRVRVTTRTVDGVLRVIRDITFLRNDQFVHVATRLENQMPVPLTGVIFKEFADWDMDFDPGDDTWNFDTGRNMVVASDLVYGGLVAGTTPQLMDLYGWDDYGTYGTVVNFPSGPIPFFDGLALLHFDLATLGGNASNEVSTAYCAGNSLVDLQAVADRATAGVGWLSASPDTFRVAAGAFVDVVVGFDAEDLFGGDHRALVRLTSNDPNEGVFDVPVLLQVIGIPDLAVFPASLSFDSTFVGYASIETLVVHNSGTDSLRVANISSSRPTFAALPSSFVVGPLNSQTVVVTFSPPAAGADGGTLTVTSNDPDQPAFGVPFSGVGLNPPIAGAAPDSFLVGLYTGETRVRQLLLSNTGGSNLRARIEAVATSSPAPASFKSVPIVQTAADPRAGVPVNDWQAQIRARGSVAAGVPPARVFPTESLPLVIEDPVGDGGPVDVQRVRGASLNGVLRVAMEMAGPLNPSNFGGYFSLDLDQNPATGDPPYYGAPGHDIGQDVVVTLFSLFAGYVDVYQTPGAYLGTFPAVVGASGFTFEIPLEVLGDDGTMNVSGVVGTSSGPTDWFPDTGHGTIRSASWLVISPAEVSVLPGRTVVLDALFDAAGLNAGDYRADITITTNDPGLGSTLIVPANLQVTGAPDIAVSAPALDFGDLFLGYSVAETLVVSNEGTDVLNVTSITSTQPVFTFSPAAFVLEPGASATVLVTFTPTAAIVYAAGLVIHSNDVDEPSITVALAGRGLIPPEIGVVPESLYVGLLSNETKVRTLRVNNTGGSDLNVIVSTGLTVPDTTSAFKGTEVVASNFENASWNPPRRETPGDPRGPGGSQPPTGPGPEINTVPRTQPPSVMAGFYTGTRLVFGITNYGEIMPYQFPPGNEHLAVGGWVSGYTVGYVDDGFLRVFWSGHDTRFGIEPVSYEELINTPSLVTVRVTTRTVDGVLKIVREFEFLRSEQFVRVTTRLENITGVLVNGVVYKEFADWDMDGDWYDDSWNYDTSRGLTIGWDQKYSGLSSSTPPNKMDCFGWSDHGNYDTYVDFPTGPVSNLDGMSLLHFDKGDLSGGGSVSTSVAYSAADNLDELKAVVDRANTRWLSVDPTVVTVPAGGHADLSVGFDATGLIGGDYAAEIRLASNDPGRDLVQVPVLLHVTGVPDIRVQPTELAYGSIFVGAAVVETLEVHNAGTDVLVVSGVTFSDPAFSNGDGAFTLDPGASRFLLIRFQPGEARAFTATASVHSNDPDHPVISVSLAGTGLVPPDVSVAPESLSVTLIRGQSAQRTLAVANSGGSDLLALVMVADPTTDSTGAVRVFPPDGSATGNLVTPGAAANTGPSGPPRTLAGFYAGTKMSFGVSDLGEIMPYQFPNGVEHLSVSTRISGYSVGFMSGGSPTVYLAGYDSRYGIEPETYQELAVTPTVIQLRVTTRTINGTMRIIRDITFRRADQFVYVATTIENLTSTPILGLIYKEFADWDVDVGAGGDFWTRETTRNMVYAWDARYVALAAKEPPTLTDLYGWGDYGAYPTVVESFPIDPVPIDGLALFHYSLGSLGSRAKVTRSVSYCAGLTRIDLFAAADRAGGGPPWIYASPGNLIVAPGQSQDVTVNFDTESLEPGEHRAVVRLQTNDPDESLVNIPVRLTVVVLPDIAATAPDFGSVYVSQSRVESVSLRNEGAAPLTITGMSTTGPFARETPGAVPVIPPGGALEVPVRFAPTSGCSPCTGALIVTSNDPDENPFTVPLSGIGVVPPQVVLGSSAIQAALAPALGPPAVQGSRTLDVANPGGSPLQGRAVPIELSLPAATRVLAVGPMVAQAAGPGDARSLGGGPDEGGYTWSSSDEPGGPVFEWADIAQGANRLALVGNDAVLAGVPIGFDFRFYGQTFSTVNVSTNGWLSFTSTLVPGSTPFTLPNSDPGAPRNLLAPFWDDLTFGTIQRAYAKREPERFVVSYVAAATLPVTGPFTFQTILYPDGRIVYQYLNVPVPAPPVGTIGIQNGDGTVGLTVSHGTSFVRRNFAVEFSPGVRWLRVVPGVFEVGAGGTLPLGILFDATGMSDGDHQASIRLMTNDLETPVLDVPVTLHVGAITAAFKVNLHCSYDDEDDDGNQDALGGDDDDDDGGGGGGYQDDDDDDGGSYDDDDDGGHSDDDDDGGRDDDDDEGPARFVRGVITLPVGYDPHDVVISSIRAGGSVPVTTTKTPRIHGQKLKVWFDRRALLATIPDGDAVIVNVVGEIDGVTWFQGTANACMHRPFMAAAAAQYHAGNPVALNWSDPPGVIPNGFDLWFSHDGGETWMAIARGVTTHSTTWSVPNIATSRGMLGLVAFGPRGPTGSWRSEEFEIVGATADLVSSRGVPGAFDLRLAGPNPSRDGPTFELALPTRRSVAIDVYDVRGARVRSYPDAEFEPGWHRVTWDGRGDDNRPLGAGVYFVRATSLRDNVTVRVAVLK